MRKPNVSLPSYRHHKPSGQAVVTFNGKDHYLGPWQSEASKTEHKRWLAEWIAAGKTTTAARAMDGGGQKTLVVTVIPFRQVWDDLSVISESGKLAGATRASKPAGAFGGMSVRPVCLRESDQSVLPWRRRKSR
jgi:hypothetical protein